MPNIQLNQPGTAPKIYSTPQAIGVSIHGMGQNTDTPPNFHTDPTLNTTTPSIAAANFPTTADPLNANLATGQLPRRNTQSTVHRKVLVNLTGNQYSPVL